MRRLDTGESASSNGIYMAIGIGVGCAVVVIVLSWYFYCHRPAKHSPASFSTHGEREYSKYKEEPDATSTLPTYYARSTECDLGPLLPYRVAAKEIELWHVLASGAHGEVHLGEYKRETVAIKKLYDGQSTDDDIRRFVDEIVTMTRFDHPRIVSLIGVVWYSPPAPLRLQCVMEYMDQGNLLDYCTNSNDSSFPYTFKATVALHIAKALAYIHAIPIVHRDLKSKNILLDGRKGAKITDFASAKAMLDNVATMTQGIGTFRWLAPEVLLESRCSAAADIYSLGVIMTEMSAYRRPYSELVDEKGKPLSEVKIMQQISKGSLRPTCSATAPTWWKDWSAQCMAADAKDRPTATLLVNVIESFTSAPSQV
ncbi:protein kinase [Achlya hypogyna]|uniref:Protein kinase n=1 Tax=Achlya hypogyna TaxID=1202772 RepID=A0A1V9Z7P9_ACHHY|nr:protein kinase [Achlya hypogyna]